MVVFHEVAYGAVVSSAPSGAPSSRNCTPTTRTLSLALADTVTVADTVAPLPGAVMETDGGVVSFETVTLTTALVVRLPAASRARAERVCAPLVEDLLSHEALYRGHPIRPPTLLHPAGTARRRRRHCHWRWLILSRSLIRWRRWPAWPWKPTVAWCRSKP